MSKLLVVTIGESPRQDIQNILDDNLSEIVEIKQQGVLDNLDSNQLGYISTISEETSILVTRLKNGNQINLNTVVVEEKIQEIVSSADNEGIKNILLLCTGSFPNLDSKNLNVYTPDQLISPVIKEIGKNKNMGLLIPDINQEQDMFLKWSKYNLKPVILAASPYSSTNDLGDLARKFEKDKVDFILMDCMGYTKEMKEELTGKVNIPVILSSTLMVKILSEIL